MVPPLNRRKKTQENDVVPAWDRFDATIEMA
jgi:hypothetical protein